MKGNYNFYIMQNGKPEKIEYSSNLKIKLSKKEKENLRRMTNKELSWWLSEKPYRERKIAGVLHSYIYTFYTYNENEQDEEVSDNILIRENGGEWREPLVADHYKD